MTSIRPRKLNGSIFVENVDAVESLLDTSNDGDITYTQSIHSGSSSRHKQKYATADEYRRKIIKDKANLSTERLANKTRHVIDRSIKMAEMKREKEFDKHYSSIKEAQSLLDDVEKQLQLQDESKRNKTRRQFEDWNNNVHGAIMTSITNQLNKLDYKEINKKKNEEFKKFLEITNSKAAIFRDIIIESEYDPLEPNRKSIKAKVSKIQDPVKIDANKRYLESSMLGESNLNMKSRTKETLSVEQWATGKIEATPHGTFARMMDESSQKRDKSQKLKTFASSIVFDHYNIPKGKEVLDAEMPVGKKSYRNPNLRLFDD